jgi:hypothetical protein
MIVTSPGAALCTLRFSRIASETFFATQKNAAADVLSGRLRGLQSRNGIGAEFLF